MSDLADRLAATPPPPEQPKRRATAHPTGFEYEWDGARGYIQTGPLAERPRTWDEFIRDAGLDPDEVEVIEPVNVRGWDGQTAEGVVRMHYYKLNVRRRSLRVDLDELIKAAQRRTPHAAKPETARGDLAYLVALGDLQLGKVDGDGPEGTVQRFMEATRAAIARYRLLKRRHGSMPIYLAHLGDCIEGYLSQSGANAWRTRYTTTEQVRIYRRLLTAQVRAFANVADRLVVVGIPGNHDEAHRPIHTYGDSWAIEAVTAVRDALDLAGRYEHVTMHTPARDELTLTLDIAGTVVGFAHGHQWRAGTATTWWAKQAHGRQPIGDADLLVAGHLHHLRIEHTGSTKTFLQLPALESGSQWWKHRTGEWGQPGIVTALVGGGTWGSLEIQ